MIIGLAPRAIRPGEESHVAIEACGQTEAPGLHSSYAANRHLRVSNDREDPDFRGTAILDSHLQALLLRLADLRSWTRAAPTRSSHQEEPTDYRRANGRH